MPTYRVVFKIPAVLYSYHDIEASSREELLALLSDQTQINQLESWSSAEEISEADSNADWSVTEVGAAYENESN